MVHGRPTWVLPVTVLHEPVAQPATVGDFKAGGIVFWVDPNDNTKGLMCAIEDQSTGVRWNNGTNTATGALSEVIGLGSGNTTTIIQNQGTGTPTTYAAELARDYRGGNHTDWYLPNKDELNQMYLKRSEINTEAAARGGSDLSASFYWSSSEKNTDKVWKQRFSNGNQSHGNKAQLNRIRAIRAF